MRSGKNRTTGRQNEAYSDELETGALRGPEIRTDAVKASAKLLPGRIECNVRSFVRLKRAQGKDDPYQYGRVMYTLSWPWEGTGV